MPHYRLDDDQGGPQPPKPPGGWKPGDNKPKPEDEDEQEEKKKS